MRIECEPTDANGAPDRGAQSGQAVAPTTPVDEVAESMRFETEDVDELVDLVKPWDVDLQQISAGKFHGEFEGIRTPRMLIYRESWLRRIVARGESPEGMIMIGTNAVPDLSEVVWCGKTIDQSRIGCSGPGGEIGFATPDCGQHVVALIRPDLVENAVGSSVSRALLTRSHIELLPLSGRRFISSILHLLRVYRLEPDLLADPFAVRSLESFVLEQLGAVTESGSRSRRTESRASRRRLVTRAIEFIGVSTVPLTALELASRLGVSQRTLELTFHEILGCTPAAYLRIRRMNQAHRDLARANPGDATVTEIAIKWGFLHAGRFSAAYRELFGCLPSETLKKQRHSLAYSPLALPN